MNVGHGKALAHRFQQNKVIFIHNSTKKDKHVTHSLSRFSTFSLLTVLILVAVITSPLSLAAHHEMDATTSAALGDQDREKYVAIGESDRMTLKFVKPAK